MAFKFLLSGVLFLLLAGLGGRAQAQTVYYSPRAVLADFFPQSRAVTYRKFAVTPALRARLERQGVPLAAGKQSVVIYVAQGGSSGQEVQGYAMIDEEMGQHQPITFAVKFSPAGAVERQEIMVYRERYGDEVRDERFRRQFVGKTAADRLRPGLDVVAVSGATISSRAMALGVRRDLLLLDELVLQPGRAQAAAAVP